jgi:hypothetical protein
MIHRLISHTSFVLKGSGWYATDYARANGKTEAAGETASKEAPTGTSADKPAPAATESKGDSAESSKSTSDKTATAKAAD